MKKWLQRIRGALGVGLTWAVMWSAVGAFLGLLDGVVMRGGSIQVGVVFDAIKILSVLGLIGGGTFSVILATAGRRRTFDEMSLPRFAAWGGGLAASIMLGAGAILRGSVEQLVEPSGLIVASIVALLGSGSAAGSLALARGADARESLDTGSDVADIGLTNAEKGELLGK